MFRPMLCKDRKPATLPEGDGWIMEPKLDGWRFLFHVTADGVRSYAGRNGSDRTGQPAEVEAALAFLPADTVVDGELMALEGNGPAVSTALARGTGLYAVLFDVLRVAGTDTTGLPWSERRALLEKMGEGFNQHVRVSEAHPLNQELHDRWLEIGLEGSVCKRTDSTYQPGKRSPDWPKVKPQETAEAVVVGFKAGKNGRTGEVGAFVVRMLEGDVETSTATKDDAQRADVKANPEDWLGRVIELRHHGLSESGVPRHPVFHRTRPDREPV